MKQRMPSPRILIAIALGPMCAAAADLPLREVASQAQFVGNVTVPRLQDGGGKFIRRVQFPKYDLAVGLAFPSNGHVYWKKQADNSPDWRDVGPSPGFLLMDPDADELVFSPDGLGPIQLRWFPEPTSQGP